MCQASSSSKYLYVKISEEANGLVHLWRGSTDSHRVLAILIPQDCIHKTTAMQILCMIDRVQLSISFNKIAYLPLDNYLLSSI